MRVLVVTKIFPNSIEPLSSPFNRQQFIELAKLCDLQILATIPWFPGASAFAKWSSAGRLTRVPSSEELFGLSIRHPRFLFLPRIGHGMTGPLYAASLLKDVLPLRGKVDVVLGSFAYPDGYAAVVLSSLLDVPSVVKLHGSDINVVARLPGPQKRLRSALPKAARIVAVSRALGQKVVELGVDASRVDVVPNGVNTTLFRPQPRHEHRALRGIAVDRRLVVYVGRLEEAKGVKDLVAAFRILRQRRGDVELALVGDGSLRQHCEAAARDLGGALHVPGGRPLEEIPSWMAAADAVTLPSWNEGMPNVIVEALASGRRVVATRVGGIPDLVDRPSLGELVEPKDPVALASALERACDFPYESEAVAKQSECLSWGESASRLFDVLKRATELHSRKAA
jgi:glycosyltransferase involved in cell wall biosynthesis